MKKKKHVTSVIVMLTASWLATASVVHAGSACSGTPINPVTDICWQCMFPAQIGSVSFGMGQESAPGNITTPACVCPDSKQGIIAGLSVAFWEHARMIETVKDPYCFPILGTGMTNPKPGFSSGTARGPGHNDNEYSFQQAHYYTFPAWSILKLFMDFPCAEQGGFDLAYMTEVDPMWNDDSLSFIINPEALLFGNPISQIACIADSVAATVTTPIDPLFWCMGSWGSFYPLTGSMNSSEPLSVNAGLAARMLFKLGRESLLFDTGINQCSSGGVITPILVKSNYRQAGARHRLQPHRPSVTDLGLRQEPALGGRYEFAGQFSLVDDEKEGVLRRLRAQLIVYLLLATTQPAFAAGKSGYIATPDACYVPEKVEGEAVHLKKTGVCGGQPGRAFVQTERQTLKVFVEGEFWQEVRVEEMKVPDVAASLAQADRVAGTVTIPKNRYEDEMNAVAGTLDSYYHSDEFQRRVKSETERIKAQVFGEDFARFYPDDVTSERKGKLTGSERVYVFISSSMPLQTVRNYASSVARLRDPRIVMVMRGFVGGMTRIQPTIRFVADVLKKQPSCSPAEGECAMLPANLVVDPLLYRRYAIDRVPAVVFARGVKAENPGLSEGDSKNTEVAASYTVYGDASLEYILQSIGRESGSSSLKELLVSRE